MLSDLLRGVDVVSSKGPADKEINSIGFDSRTACPGQLYFAIPGTRSDGHAYIPDAIARGVVAVVCEHLPGAPDPAVTYIEVADSNVALGRIAANFYGNPSRKLRLVGVTGTNGKTTTATLLYDTFRMLGYKAGLISTVTYRIDSREMPSTHTTPDAVRLNGMLAEMVEAGCEYCFMEVSSHSIVQRRIEGLHFAGGIFTNITHDHLDYHKTFAEYIKAKKLFFDGLPASAWALVNIDDRNGRVMVQNTKADIRTLSMLSAADFKCRIVEMLFDGMLLNLDGTEVWVGFLGRFNAYNLLSVYAAATLLGADRTELLTAMSRLHPVNGRFEYIRSAEGVTAVIDYAHTPDALQNVINTINEIREGGQKLYVVVGCGGNRDRTKRPEMARIAARGGDLAILTSDNPRLEEPEAIIGEMKAGLEQGDRYLAITDRREAIRAAAMMAAPHDIILVAGKGHETYQDVGGIKHHFDDKEEVRAAFGIDG
ncbi:MAG: UDP-N-acetylmuramoyl-L-alanyl-D-glutamate--2,6-diaminopimelate ligase [Rikenellaceae bacterium]|nr:UDP-N-acetylmuramoyl-L-alanyl-D-glutamate--2,6-diaminopimelate ligase [Rikenellaceae bacterium]